MMNTQILYEAYFKRRHLENEPLEDGYFLINAQEI